MKKILIALGAVIALIVGFKFYDIFMDKKAQGEVEKFLSKTFRKTGDVQYTSVDYNPFTQEITVEGIYYRAKSGESYRIGKVVIKEFSGTSADFSLYDIEPLSSDEKFFLKKYGYETQKFNIEASYNILPEQNTFLIKKLRLDYPDAFSITISVEIGNYDHKFWKYYLQKKEITDKDSFEILSEMGSLKLLSARFYYKDKGLKEKVLEVEAKEKGLSPEEFKNQLIKDLEKGRKFAKNEFDLQLYDAAIKFLKEGKEVIIDIKPRKSVKFQDIVFVVALRKDENALIKLLNPSVSVK
ncbi:MAG TPA: hypothetical protein EYG91_01875 [Aquifex aeolicus]|nr:hypothetical protein [Aquifex aeolicus]